MKKIFMEEKKYEEEIDELVIDDSKWVSEEKKQNAVSLYNSFLRNNLSKLAKELKSKIDFMGETGFEGFLSFLASGSYDELK
jgi:hypothetical protein